MTRLGNIWGVFIPRLGRIALLVAGIGLASTSTNAASLSSTNGTLDFSFDITWSDQIEFDGGSSFEDFTDFSSPIGALPGTGTFSGDGSLTVNGQLIDNDDFNPSTLPTEINAQYNSTVSATADGSTGQAQGLGSVFETTEIYFQNSGDNQSITLDFDFEFTYSVASASTGGVAFSAAMITYELSDDGGTQYSMAGDLTDGLQFPGSADGGSFDDFVVSSDPANAQVVFSNLPGGEVYTLTIVTTSKSTALADAVVPVPAALPLFAGGLGLLGLLGWRKRKIG